MQDARGLGRACAMVVLAVLVAACDSRPERPRVMAVVEEAPRQALNTAYSLLYEQARGLATLRWVMQSRLQPQATREAIGIATAYYADLARQLERLSAAHPALQLDRAPSPQGEGRSSLCEAWQGGGLPAGHAGSDYERGLLLAFLGALEEQRRLAAQIADTENVVELRGFVQVQRQALDALYWRFDARLRAGVAVEPSAATGRHADAVVRRAG